MTAGVDIRPGDRVEHIPTCTTGRVVSVNGSQATWEPFGPHHKVQVCELSDLVRADAGEKRE